MNTENLATNLMVGLILFAVALAIVFYSPVQTTPKVGKVTEFIFTEDVVSGAPNSNKLIQILRHANKGDIINIHLFTYGGDAPYGYEVSSAIEDSRATVVIHVDSGAMSMGGVWACHADKLVIKDTAFIMMHTIQQAGKALIEKDYDKPGTGINEAIRSLLAAFRVTVEQCNFLTKEEIVRILDGEDVYITGAKINKRLKGK